jgi:hypothetical protein
MVEVVLQIIFILLATICFLGGANLLRKGAMDFLPAETPPQIVLDNLLRFLSGIYFASGLLFVYAVVFHSEIGNIRYCFGIIVLFSGLGRWLSKAKLGSAGRYFDTIMWIEIGLGILILILTYFT